MLLYHVVEVDKDLQARILFICHNHNDAIEFLTKHVDSDYIDAIVNKYHVNKDCISVYDVGWLTKKIACKYHIIAYDLKNVEDHMDVD